MPLCRIGIYEIVTPINTHKYVYKSPLLLLLKLEKNVFLCKQL